MDNIRKTIKTMGYILNGNTEVLKYPNEYLQQLKRKSSKEILETLKQGLLVEQQEIRYRYIVPLIYFENVYNNKFYLYSNVKIEKNYYDFIITINNIPIVVIECNRDVERGCLHLQRCFFEEVAAENLKTVQLLVSIDNNSIKYKTNQQEDNWKSWHLSSNQNIETIQEKIVSFFNKETLLNFIQNYIIYIGETKAISTYYQYFATEEIWKSKEKNKRVYLPTGTGRTTAILFMIEKLKNKRPNTKILIVAERLYMLEILQEKISKSSNIKIEIANTRMELEEMLQDVSKNIIITTIQKLKSYDKEYLEEIYIISDIIDSYSEQVLKRMGNFIFKNSVLIQYMGIPQQDENYVYYYSTGQAVQDKILTKMFYAQKRMILSDTRRIEKVAQNIFEDFKNSYQKEKKAIIIANKSDCVTYIEKIGNEQSIATTSLPDKTKNDEFLQDIIRENGSFEIYKKESFENFNNGNLEILVVSTLQELMEITTNKVDKIYLTQILPNRMIPTIFKILSRKETGKARGVIVDYAENRGIIKTFTTEKDEEEKNVISEISSIKQEAREMFLNLCTSSEIENIKKDMETIIGLNSNDLLIRCELFCEKVKKFLEKISFIIVSDELSKLLEKGEAQRYKERMKEYLEIIDKIAVIYAQEVKDKQLIKEWCSILGITSFKFTAIQKNDLLEYPNLGGVWKNLTDTQKAEALKNRFKIYGLNYEKSEKEWQELENNYKLKKINDEQYCKQIEEKRKQFLEKIQVSKVPIKLKNEEFSVLLYNEIKSASYIGQIKIKSNEKLINIILEIMTKIKQEVKIGWKNNFYVWKKIELGIIETIYDYMEDKEIFMTEDVLDELLNKIKQIAIQTIDICNNKTLEKLYYIKKKNAYAVGKFEGNDFIVSKDSITVEGISQHMSLTKIRKAEELRKNGIIINNQFMQDYKFTSSSAAACVILGRSANGRIEWKDRDGKTIFQNQVECLRNK